MSTNTVVITSVSQATFNGLPGAVADLIANHTAGAADIQRALVAYEAGLLAQITAQTTAASTAIAATTTLQGNVDRIVEAAIALNSSDPAVQALVTEASVLSSTSRRAAAQAAVDKAAADLAAAQAALATHS